MFPLDLRRHSLSLITVNDAIFVRWRLCCSYIFCVPSSGYACQPNLNEFIELWETKGKLKNFCRLICNRIVAIFLLLRLISLPANGYRSSEMKCHLMKASLEEISCIFCSAKLMLRSREQKTLFCYGSGRWAKHVFTLRAAHARSGVCRGDFRSVGCTCVCNSSLIDRIKAAATYPCSLPCRA